ncbi:MAG: hypothetical protein DCF19_07055 [Pseudanabaena frigida]|uniref:DUF4253 domain-containing protein n=1 Tax=Pseudanabaena frigida TaxID=945775 RepID=A0A2W4WBU3_9CYAN|nr:MAG: hypothetical protein DCF19_07055 [Pseudanabaena frigida]
MDKYQSLKDVGTNGANYDLETEDIIEHLILWDAKYGIELSDVSFDAVNITFIDLPEDLTELALDIYEFCPDIIDQHFGCMAEAIEMMEGAEQDIFADVRELIKGVDLTDENYGFELLKRSLALNKIVPLWWD